MYFMYIDESGLNRDRDRFLILATLLCHERDWKKIDKKIREFKMRYLGSNKENLKRIRRWKHDSRMTFKKLSEDDRKNLDRDLYDILNERCLEYMAALIDRERMYNRDEELYFKLAYRFLLQRYHYSLESKCEMGIVIMDKAKRTSVIEKLYNVHRNIMKEGIEIKKEDGSSITFQPETILENLFFEDDEHSNHLQLTDYVAAAVHAKFNRGYDKYFRRIEKNFRHSDDGEIMGYGLKIFPK